MQVEEVFSGFSLVICTPVVQHQTSRRKLAAIIEDEDSGSDEAR